MKTILNVNEAKVQSKTDRDGMQTKTIAIRATMPYDDGTLIFLGMYVEEQLVVEMNVKQTKLGIAEKGVQGKKG